MRLLQGQHVTTRPHDPLLVADGRTTRVRYSVGALPALNKGCVASIDIADFSGRNDIALDRALRIYRDAGSTTVRSSGKPCDEARLPETREREVLSHIVAGRTYAETAEALFISEKTVSVHVSNLLRKTGTRSRVEVADLVRRTATS